MMKTKFIQAYMDVAERFSQLSSAKRLQVGAIAVKDDRVVSIGYNGTPTGWDNCCEYTIEDAMGYETGKSRPEVIHAESNCISKLAKSNESGDGATMFITHAPCMDCAKLIYQSGISVVYYKHNYRSMDGVDFLLNSNVQVTQVT